MKKFRELFKHGEQIEVLDSISNKNKEDNRFISFVKKIFNFIIVFISSFFVFFINLFWDLIYNILIFFPYLIGKREFPNIKRKVDKCREYPEIFLLVVLFIVVVITIINFVYPNSPFRITNLPEEVNIVTEEEGLEDDDIDNTENSDNSAIDADVNSNSGSGTTSLYKKYQKYNINDISISDLKKENSDTVAWLQVDKTNINYPVVQTTDNDYYINHSFTKAFNNNGWIFGDYRNDWNLSTKNNIIYGHHLLNQTMFGSISKMFTEDWQNNSNHLILTKTENRLYTWKIFSVYEIPTELYYLANAFTSDNAYKQFINTLKSRSIYDFNVDISNTTNILTLSTCNDTNDGRLVVHATLISTQ